jgi:hypothetical protein
MVRTGSEILSNVSKETISGSKERLWQCFNTHFFSAEHRSGVCSSLSAMPKYHKADFYTQCAAQNKTGVAVQQPL